MTTMVTTFGWNQISTFGHGSERLLYTRATSQHMGVLMQTQKLWFSHKIAGECQFAVINDDLHGSQRQKKGFRVVLLASPLRQEALVTWQTSHEEPSFNWAIGNACNFPSIIEAPVASAPEPISLKSHPVKRRHFPANGTTISNASSHTSFEVKSSSTSVNGLKSPLHTSIPSERVMVYFKLLDVTGIRLVKCLKHASGLVEDDLLNLLTTLSSCGFDHHEIKTMLSKYPPLVKVKGPQVEQCLRYYSSLGFTSSVVLSLFVKRPALLACDLERASQVIEFLVSMGMQKEDLGVILSSRPHILEQDVGILKSTVSALMKARISQTDITILFKRAPSVFTTVQEDIQNSLKFWSGVGVEGKYLCRALLRRPNLLSYNTESMLSTYKYLQWWMEPSDIAKLVSRYAELLAFDPQTKLEPLIKYFLQLGVSEKDVGKVILRRPQLMSCTIQRLQRTVGYLKSLGVKDDMLGKVLTTSPQVFTLNSEDKLYRGVEFLRSIGLDKERDMEFIFSRNAQIFCCSIEKNLQPTFDFFLSIGLEKEVLAKMIVLFPSMLGQSIEQSLAPKYKYLINDMKRTVQELIEFPQFFGYSLEKRIKPRHKIMSEQGLRRSLPSMLACTDNDFHKRYVVPYTTFPKQMATSEMGETLKKQTALKKRQVATKQVLPPDEVQIVTAQKDSLPLNIEKLAAVATKKAHQEQIVLNAEEQLVCVHEEPGAVSPKDQVSRLHQEQAELYPPSFTKYYKNLSPCGMWIHAYKFDY